MATPDSRTPVLVGVAAVQRARSDSDPSLEPVTLMAEALERAAEDAGRPELLARADSIRIPRGFFRDADPARQLAERFGAAGARTEIAEIGVLQTTLLGRAARDIAEERADVVLLAGGEARATGGQKARWPGAPTGADTQPDTVLRPEGEILSRAELQAGLGMPVTQYALVENALRAADGISLEEHRRQVDDLWSGLSRIAADNPGAWARDAIAPEDLKAGEANPMLAFPYTKRHCSQWNVNQAAGLVLCSLGTARALGIAKDRWVFPLAVVDSNAMRPLSERAALHRSFGFARAGEAALAAAKRDFDGAHLELYSCFPAAVRIQQREFGLTPERPASLTGGMTFAGGPLNHFVLQALDRMVAALRGDPGSLGVATAVSGMLTKQGVTLWSSEPGPGFQFLDVSDRVAADTAVSPVHPEAETPDRVVSYTVLGKRSGGPRGVLLCEDESGLRRFVTTDDATVMAELQMREACGRPLHATPEGQFAGWG
ncbi:MAG: acetyl-CoA acetyltransferase [Proteobacteria bacterium]|nr:acetyl-CoA acetyltransferase [Pseudomonadota bacterium]